MVVGDTHVFLGFLTPVLTQPFFPKPMTSFLTCFCRGERRKYAGKKSRHNRGSNSNHQVMSPTRSPLSHPGVTEYKVNFDHPLYIMYLSLSPSLPPPLLSPPSLSPNSKPPSQTTNQPPRHTHADTVTLNSRRNFMAAGEGCYKSSRCAQMS